MHFQDAPERVFGSRAKIRVLRTLYGMKEEELTGREIARRCHLTPARTHAVLKEIAGEGLVKMRILGRNHMYAFNSNSILMPSVRLIFDHAYSAEAQLKKLASDELADKRVLSAFSYGARLSSSEPNSVPLKIMVVADTDSSTTPLAKKAESLTEKIRSSLGETPEIKITSVDQLRGLSSANNQDTMAALRDHRLLIGESPMVLTSEKWHSQRFRFSLFRRS